jgi:hypothetical protein
MSVTIISGLTGTGKTYFMTKLALKHAIAFPDMPIYANYHINNDLFPKKIEYFDDPEKLSDISHALVLIDDGAIWFNNRRWHEFSYDLQYKIINNRKDGLKIYVTTQYFEGIESTIRENCHFYYECEKLIGSGEFSKKIWGIIRVRQYYPRLHDKIRRKPLSSKYFLLRKKYTDMYDTYEKITRKMSIDKKNEVKYSKKLFRKYNKIEKKRSK